jgi:hypothetical protein
MKARWILLVASIGLIAVMVTFPAAQADKRGAHEHGPACIEGTWVVKTPDGAIWRETLMLGSNGQTIHFALNSLRLAGGDPTLGGMFPDATFDLTGPARGSGVRTGPTAFKFKIISWAVNVIDGIRSEVAYIRINSGVVHFPDCETQEVVMSVSYFLPEQDADGDGIPDEGEEPFLVLSDLLASATKFFP